MLSKKNYANGPQVFKQTEDKLTYFFKNGNVKAEGPFSNGLMGGEWRFYRETGQLWQIAHFMNSNKHGEWVRYDRNDKPEYQEHFEDGKMIKKK
ncbi:MAG: hypothetical protein IH598_11945 [Bacteroidales bacterium]|nr:hypothetical protein [Bacteroidales bacterium]